MKKSIILKKENEDNKVIEITAYHLRELSILEKTPDLCKLNLIGGELCDLYQLKKCPKLYELNLKLTKVDNFSSLQEIKSIRCLEVAGMQNEMISTISKMTDLKSLSLKYCHIRSLRGLRNLENLTELSIGEMEKDAGILEIFSIQSIRKLKLFIPREYEQTIVDWTLRSLKLNLPRLEWLELEMPEHEFRIETLTGLKLKHFGVSGKKFFLQKEENEGFGEYEGYVGDKKDFNGVIFCLREQNVKHKEVNEFWFSKIVLDEVKYHEQLRAKGEGDDAIKRSKQTATKFKSRFKAILSQLGMQADLTKVAFCNVNSKGGGDSVSLESGYQEALENAPDKLENIISYMEPKKIIICTCKDIYVILKQTWEQYRNVIIEPEKGIEYSDGTKGSCFMCNLGNKEVYVYQIKHPSRSCKVNGEN